MKPLILDFITPRTASTFTVPFEYDNEKALNVVDVDGICKPFIDLDPADVALLTKTKEKREADDDHFAAIEMGTKTKYGEREDLHDYLMELQTKTLKVRESDE